MKRILLTAAIVVSMAMPAVAQPSDAQSQSRSYYNGSGSFAGSSVTRGASTSFSDNRGSFAGSAIRNSNGSTSFYDGRGRFTGSSVNTAPRR
jgi:hypothetical protein